MPHATIVSTRTLSDHLDHGWVVLDCRFHLQDDTRGRTEYAEAHIPGAAYVSLADDLAGQPTGANGRHPLPTPEEMIATFGRLGIDRQAQVVAYDQGPGMFAARLWWMLRYMGHDAVAVLDGGWAKWVAESRPSRAGVETHAARVFTGDPRREWAIGVDAVLQGLGVADRVLVDARAPERFAGRTEPLDRVAGHIPGAVNRPWTESVTSEGTLRPAEDLLVAFRNTLGGIDPSRAVMTCGSGVSACFNLLAMAHAGLAPSQLYVGSWSEWSSDPSRPVETGSGRHTGGE